MAKPYSLDLRERVVSRVLAGERVRSVATSHARTGGVGDFSGLQVEGRIWKPVERAGVIIVKVRNDYGFDERGIHSDFGEALNRVAQDRPASPLSLAGVVARIDHDRPILVANYPEEIIHRVRRGVVVVKKE